MCLEHPLGVVCGSRILLVYQESTLECVCHCNCVVLVHVLNHLQQLYYCDAAGHD